MSAGPLYKLAILVAAILFVIRIISGNPILSSLGRAAILFLGILLTFFVAGQLLKMLIAITEPGEEETEDSEELENGSTGEEVKSV